MRTMDSCLTLVKDRQRFIFRYAEGQEAALLASFVELAAKPDSDFDWFDAAVLSYKMGQRMDDQNRPIEMFADREQHAERTRDALG